MIVDFLQPADDEFAEAIAYYNLQSEGLGLEFAAEVKSGLVGFYSILLHGHLCLKEPDGAA